MQSVGGGGIRSSCTKTHTKNKGNKKYTTSIRHEVYDKSGNLAKEIRDLVIKRISYLLLPGAWKEDTRKDTFGGSSRMINGGLWYNDIGG